MRIHKYVLGWLIVILVFLLITVLLFGELMSAEAKNRSQGSKFTGTALLGGVTYGVKGNGSRGLYRGESQGSVWKFATDGGHLAGIWKQRHQDRHVVAGSRVSRSASGSKWYGSVFSPHDFSLEGTFSLKVKK